MAHPGPTIDPSAIDRILQEHGAEPRETPPASAQSLAAAEAIDLDVLDLSQRIRDMIENGYEVDGHYPSRSEADAAVAAALVGVGCTDGQILWVFEKYPIGEKFVEKGKNGEKYLATTIKNARKHVASDPKESTGADQKSKACEVRIVSCEELLTTEYREPPAVIGEGILPQGCGLILDGESGEGKSLFTLELGIHFVLGRDCWNLQISKSHSVFLFQFENTLPQQRFRLSRMIRGLGIDARELHGHLSFSDPGTRIDLRLKRDHERTLRIVQESQAEIIIWDPLSSIHTQNENDNVQIRSVLDTLTWIARQTGTSNIVVHHFGKPNPDLPISHRGRGGSSIRDWCDTKISVTRKQHEHKILRTLTFVKVRNGPERPSILLERDENFLHHVVDEEALCPPSRVREILAEIGGKVEKQADLVEAIVEMVGCSKRGASGYIKRAVEAGYLGECKGENGRTKSYQTRG